MSARLGTETVSISAPADWPHGVTTSDEHGSVLVAAGDPDIRRLISGPLVEHGFSVVEAADVEKALEMTSSFSIDVAVVEAAALGIDWPELLGRWRDVSAGEFVPLVLVAETVPADLLDGFHSGVHDCLQLPLEPVDVLARIHSALGVKRRHDDLRHRMDELQQLALTDPLTGIYNRRHIDAELTAMTSAARRQGTPLGVLIIDIDRFKRINDRHGHEVGDRALRAVAHHIRSVVRAEDVVGRWGGDEFIVLLPSTDREAALGLARRLCRAVARLSAADATGGPVTISVGCAAGDPDEAALTSMADAALRRAKAQGRNCVSG